VQIERCHGVQKCASVRHDEEKYLRYAKGIHDAIHQFFDGQIHVEILDVETLYALEIRVMPEELHPRFQPARVGKDAEMAGAFTVFSKIETKKWPQKDAVLHAVQDLCRVPVRITMLGRELKAVSNPDVPEALEVHRAVNQTPAGTEALAALRRVEFQCANERGMNIELYTGSDGRAEVPLFPGIFRLGFMEGSGYDKLTPNSITVPAHLSVLEVTITASLKKKCTFSIVDHLNRPFNNFALRLVHQDPRVSPVTLRSKVDGKCRGRLGRGIYTATYDGGSTLERDWPIAPLMEDIEVHDTETPIFFRINVERIRFDCEVILRTRFEEPVSNCPFAIKDAQGNQICARVTTDIGVAACDLPAGFYSMLLMPSEESPFVGMCIELHVNDDGTFTPMEQTVATKHCDVNIHLVTPDGEPAPDCLFYLEPQFAQSGVMARAKEMKCQADEAGVAIAPMGLLEPYIFQVKPNGKAAAYMPQHFVFQTDRREVTVVVARSIFGTLAEDKVAIVIDTSGSMQVYLEDVKIALNQVITEQLFQSKKQFNILTYTDKVLAFRPDLVECSQENLEDSMRFCDAFEAGGGSELSRAMQHAFQFPNLEAMYIVTDGKTEMKDAFLNHVRSMYFTHPKRPKLHTIGINCVPRRLTWQGLQAVALLTQATFRPVCLEQANTDAAPPPMMCGDSIQWSGHDLAPATSNMAEGVTDEEEVEYYQDDGEYDTA